MQEWPHKTLPGPTRMCPIAKTRPHWAHKFSMGSSSLLCWKKVWNSSWQKMISHWLSATQQFSLRFEISITQQTHPFCPPQKCLNLFKIRLKVWFLATWHSPFRMIQNCFLYSKCPLPMDSPSFWPQTWPFHFSKGYNHHLSTNPASYP